MSGVNVRKSSGWSKGAYQSDVSCEMFWSSSSRRIVAHIDTVSAAEHGERLSSVGAKLRHCVRDEMWKLQRPQHHTLTSACHYRSSISSVWRLVGAFSTSTANTLLSSSNRHFWTSDLANRTKSFSANCAHGNTAVEICLLIDWQQGKWPRFPCSI